MLAAFGLVDLDLLRTECSAGCEYTPFGRRIMSNNPEMAVGGYPYFPKMPISSKTGDNSFYAVIKNQTVVVYIIDPIRQFRISITYKNGFQPKNRTKQLGQLSGRGVRSMPPHL